MTGTMEASGLNLFQDKEGAINFLADFAGAQRCVNNKCFISGRLKECLVNIVCAGIIERQAKIAVMSKQLLTSAVSNFTA